MGSDPSRRNGVKVEDPCGKINDDVLDDLILGRSLDEELVLHLKTCQRCRIRFAEQQRFVTALKSALPPGGSDAA